MNYQEIFRKVIDGVETRLVAIISPKEQTRAEILRMPLIKVEKWNEETKRFEII